MPGAGRGRTRGLLLAATTALCAAPLVLTSPTAGLPAATRPGLPAAAPYFEMGGSNPGNLGAGIDAGLRQVTAAFVIGDGCVPTWDDGRPVARARSEARAIRKAQDRGVQVIISFGGAGGIELARGCTRLAELVAAYQAVIDEFGITSIDFDIEGDAIDPVQEKASIARRFAAIRALQAANPGLVVSATLGVGPGGLLADQMSFLRVAGASGTTVDLVNLMTMDYGEPVPGMGRTAVRATRAGLAQVRSIWPSYRYANMGITPMIGRNDSHGEVTRPEDARTIYTFAASHRVGRLAFWSLNRDQQCRSALDAPRDDCSSVRQRPLEFARVFLGHRVRCEGAAGAPRRPCR